MATYSFETITAAQALAFAAGDTLTFGSGTATQATVAYDSNGDITVTVGALSVEFSGGLASASQSAYFNFPDGSHLYVGDSNANLRNLQQDGNSAALFGGGGDDIFTMGAGGGVAQGNQGNDQITALGGSATLYGGQGDDFLTANGHDDFLQGNKGDDVLAGGTRDTVLGGQGNDTITHGSGVLDGNLGNDRITGSGMLMGEDGNDTITGSGTPGGFDTMLGGNGDDSLTSNVIGSLSGASMDGGAGNDTITGGAAQDAITGGAGNDVIFDQGGQNNLLDGGDGNNTLAAASGTGTIIGGSGNDVISTLDASPYVINAGGGDDSIRGSRGADTISAGDGNDTVDGSGGADVIASGSGADLIQFLNAGSTTPGQVPQILDWSAQDTLQLHNNGPTLSGYTTATAPDFTTAVTSATNLINNNHFVYVAVQVGPDVIVFANGGSPMYAIDLVGRSLADISAHNFI